MNLTHALRQSGYRNSAGNPVWMDALRILLGIFLFVKGILFLEYNSEVFYTFSQNQDLISLQKAPLMTSLVHIIGGLMIIFGFLTRLALLCQIPVVLGAVLLVNGQRGLFLENTELWVSLAVFSLLLFFMVMGPGRYSVDNLVLRPKRPSPPANP
ncbi:DoxX family protein [Pontibacter mangrovi]|uniref:DoxX family protein n=1 Tax=Pontibacter mangrovi TaxID=2589816 RepID=A0A501WKZ7_9BACT|nr:DoxX family protein [Pontibacter mangrovi]TPE46326.1 DoxX family protein [Pontibacter mangrovi]